MRPYRAIPIGGKDFVYGWLFERAGGSYIIPFTDNYHTPASFVLTFVQVIPETVGQFVTKDKNKKDIYRGDETNKGIAIAAFKDWVWTYTKDDSTYHWHINIKEDIELIKGKDNE